MSNPQQKLYVQFHALDPKGSAPSLTPVTQDEDEDTSIRQSELVKNLLPIQLQSLRNTADISQDAVYSALGNAFLASTPHAIPTALQDSKSLFSPPMDMEEPYNGMVHPVTKEKNKIQKLIEEPPLYVNWMKARCIELGQLAQG